MSEDQIRFRLPSRPEYCDIARLATAGIARRAGFSEEATEEIKTAVAEACLNVVLHAYNGKSGEIQLLYIVKEGGLEIVIEDSGKGFDVEATLKNAVTLDPSRPRTSGFGLLIMKSLMDRLEIESRKGSGSRVRMAKERPSLEERGS